MVHQYLAVGLACLPFEFRNSCLLATDRLALHQNVLKICRGFSDSNRIFKREDVVAFCTSIVLRQYSWTRFPFQAWLCAWQWCWSAEVQVAVQWFIHVLAPGLAVTACLWDGAEERNEKALLCSHCNHVALLLLQCPQQNPSVIAYRGYMGVPRMENPKVIVFKRQVSKIRK